MAVSPRSIAAQLGGYVCSQTGAFIPPVHVTTTFRRDPYAEPYSTPVYGRSDNQTYLPVEQVIAKLEGGSDCLLFSSGMAAASAVVFSLKPGDRIIAPARFYAGIWEWLTGHVQQWNIAIDFVNFLDLRQLTETISDKPCSLVWLETPTTPGLDIYDIQAIAAIAKGAGARLLVDNTASSPVLTCPITLGADIVLHSATKALNGHDDLIAGALVTAEKDEFWERIKGNRNKTGSILGAFEAWLLGRGIRTLYPRVEQCCASAALIASWLRQIDHPALSQVIYPGFEDHPNHQLARIQMSERFGNMISLRLAGGEIAAKNLMAKVQVWRSGTSFGGVQSMLEHRASVEAAYPPTPDDLVRLSVGLEDRDELYADLIQALDTISLRKSEAPRRNTVQVREPFDCQDPCTELYAAAHQFLSCRETECLALIGSHSRNLGNEASDVDILMLTDAEDINERLPDSTASFHGTCTRSAKAVVMGFELDVTAVTYETITRIAHALSDYHALAPAMRKPQFGLIAEMGNEAAALLTVQFLTARPLHAAGRFKDYRSLFPKREFIEWRSDVLDTVSNSMLKDARGMIAQGQYWASILRIRMASLHLAWKFLLQSGCLVEKEKWVLHELSQNSNIQGAREVKTSLEAILFGSNLNSICNAKDLHMQALGLRDRIGQTLTYPSLWQENYHALTEER